ncbi:MAG: hypothetical protein NT067_07235 [Candidatus Diapherotrites archaeon]|nr:hypothetical protein [Candidatus Diapherotrites archaeon]
MEIDSSDGQLGFIVRPTVFVCNYIAFCFLSWTVLLCFASLMFFLINFSPSAAGWISMQFFSFFSFLDPKFAQPALSLDEGDIILVFSVTSLLFSLPFTIAKLVLKEKFKKEHRPSFRQRAKAHIIVISFFFILGIISISAPLLGASGEKGAGSAVLFYFIFAGFFAVAVVADLLYIFFSGMADSIASNPEQAIRNLGSGM